MPSEKHYIGGPTATCPHCQAMMWDEERVNKSQKKQPPEFAICCGKGAVKLPLLKEAPEFLKNLMQYVDGGPQASNFRLNIRAYNSMFAFTSQGAKVSKEQNNCSTPWVFTMYGLNHHFMGSLLPLDGRPPTFLQLYIIDTENEVKNRMNAITKKKEGEKQDGNSGAKSSMMGIDEYGKKSTRELNENTVAGLVTMLDTHNCLSQKFRMWRDRYKQDELSDVEFRLIGKRKRDARQYNLPTTSEIAGIVVDDPDSDGKRDIVIQLKNGLLIDISELHPSYMALQYPLLFPYGEDGFHIDIPYENQIKMVRDDEIDDEIGNGKKRKNITMREYYAFRLQQRAGECQTLLRGGRLYQQYVVDAYATIEQSRLQWVKCHQKEIRCDLYNGIKEAVRAGDTKPGSAGRVILPSSFTGGPRYMIQYYQDAIALCRELGPPELFITFTCNPNWPEIAEAIKMFPHAHILLWLQPNDKPRSLDMTTEGLEDEHTTTWHTTLARDEADHNMLLRQFRDWKT